MGEVGLNADRIDLNRVFDEQKIELDKRLQYSQHLWRGERPVKLDDQVDITADRLADEARCGDDRVPERGDGEAAVVAREWIDLDRGEAVLHGGSCLINKLFEIAPTQDEHV